MRLRQLSLQAFGKFSGKVFDFGPAPDHADFHLIYGPNEAGKTTTMEAYLRLLYGFNARESYDFRHQRKNLSVSAVLEVGGEPRAFTRLPSAKGNLRGEENAVLLETALSSHLGGLSMADYRSVLCLDDATIEQGGEAIARAEGNIGQLLFQAAAGVEHLPDLLEAEREAADALYRSRARTTKLAELKRALAEIEQQIRAGDIDADRWGKLKAALAAAEAEEDRLREALTGLRANAAKTQALQRALPLLAEHERLDADLTDVGDYPARLDITPEAVVAMMQERTQAAAELQQLDTQLTETAAALKALELAPDRLALTAELEDLDTLHGRMKLAVLDLPKRRREVEESQAEMLRIASGFGAALGTDPQSLVTAPADISELETLLGQMRQAGAACETGASEIEALEDRIAQSSAALELLRQQHAQSGVSELLARHDADGLAPAFAAAEQSIAAAERGLQDALAGLTRGSVSFSALPDCPLAPPSAAEQATQHQALVGKIDRVKDRQAALSEEIAALRAQQDLLSKGTGLIDDRAAQEAKNQRDQLWQAHRAALTDETAEAFAQVMHSVDAIARDRLSNASQLGALRTLEQDLAGKDAQLAELSLQIGQLRGEAQEIEDKAAKIAEAIGLPPISPAALADWVLAHANATNAQRNCDTTQAAHRDILDRADRLLQELTRLLPIEAPSLEAALTAARRLAEEERRGETALNGAAQKRSAHKEELARRLRRQTQLDEELKTAEGAWQAKVQALYAGQIAPARLAQALDQLHALREQEGRRAQAARQVAGMEDDQRQFAARIAALALRFDLPDEDPLDTHRALSQIAQDAQVDLTRRNALTQSAKTAQEKRAQLETRLAALDHSAAEMGKIFPARVDTSSFDALLGAMSRAKEVIDHRARRADVTAQIQSELSVPDLGTARSLIGSHTLVDLKAAHQTLNADISRLEAELTEATATRANAARDLGSVTGSAEIAKLVEERATLELEIEETLTTYLTHRFTLRAAEEALRRYRDTHRSGMLAATEAAFAGLTSGAYQRLVTQPQGGAEVLKAMDATGALKDIADMSKGTRFQLYLALRAAAYEQMVAQGTRLPFFCDDIFETFDEDRTRAACQLMERIGQSGQAIYLTHHRHVVEIAREVCAVPPKVHTLEG